MVRIAVTFVLWALLGSVASVHAQPDQNKSVAVLPTVITGNNKKLEMYSRPVAAALAGRIASKSARSAKAVAGSGSVGGQVGWVVHIRMIAKGDTVRLEARVRDPNTGQSSSAIGSTSEAIVRVDSLTEELADDIVKTMNDMEKRRRSPHTLERVKVRMNASQDAQPSERQMSGYRPTDVLPTTAPALSSVVVEIQSKVAMQGVLNVTKPLFEASVKALSRVGISAGATAGPGATVLQVSLQEIEFFWLGVLAARGKVRFRVRDGAGGDVQAIVVNTATVVGDCGDRHAALVRLLCEQAVDIAAPRLKLGAL